MSKNTTKNRKNKNRGKNNTAESRRRAAERQASIPQNGTQAPQSRFYRVRGVHPDMRLIRAEMVKLESHNEIRLLNIIVNQYKSAFKAGHSVRQVEEWLYGVKCAGNMGADTMLHDSCGVVFFDASTVQNVSRCFELSSLDSDSAA